MDKKKIIAIVVAAVLVVAIVGVFIGLKACNTAKPEATISKMIEAQWVDATAPKPSEIKLRLLTDGTTYNDNLVLNDANAWTLTCDNLSGGDVDYKLEVTTEDPNFIFTVIDDDESTSGAFIIEVTDCITEFASIDWNGLADAKRPEKVTVKLMANGEASGDVTDLTAPDWHCKWPQMPLSNADGAIKYTLEIVDSEGLKFSTKEEAMMGIIANGFMLTYVPEKPVSTTVTNKVTLDWNGLADSARPKKATAQLFADGILQDAIIELTAANKWQGSWPALPTSDKDGIIKYAVKLADVSGYEFDITKTSANETNDFKFKFLDSDMSDPAGESHVSPKIVTEAPPAEKPATSTATSTVTSKPATSKPPVVTQVPPVSAPVTSNKPPIVTQVPPVSEAVTSNKPPIVTQAPPASEPVTSDRPPIVTQTPPASVAAASVAPIVTPLPPVSAEISSGETSSTASAESSASTGSADSSSDETSAASGLSSEETSSHPHVIMGEARNEAEIPQTENELAPKTEETAPTSEATKNASNAKVVSTAILLAALATGGAGTALVIRKRTSDENK